MKYIIAIFISFFIYVEAHAQVARHPRVSQIEKSLARDGLELLKGRFPDKPFLLKVRIEPLFRDNVRRDPNNERLPYFDITSEEIVDEWDDPNTATTALIGRVRKIHVAVSIPSNLTDDEIAELKDTLMGNLGMIEGRDTVEINKRNWGSLDQQAPKEDPLLSRQALAWTGIGWLALMLALMGMAWYATSRIARALKESAKASEKSSPATAMSQAMPTVESPKHHENTNGGHGDVRFIDPIKTREMVSASVKILAKHKCFPCMEDILILDRFGRDNPRQLGAVLIEFPSEVMLKILGVTTEEHWLEALSDPSEATPACVEILNKLMRVQRNDMDPAFQELLMLVNRLDSMFAEFFSGLDQSEAFAILAGMPKAQSLKIAREYFPGGWGMLVDPSFTPDPLAADRIAQLRNKALLLKPLRDISIVSRWKKQRDLIEFLRTADPNTEKEIYRVAGERSTLASIRPPFYKIFSMSDEALKKLVPLVHVEEWANVLFNCPREERRAIEKHFGDKMKFRYLELLKSYDSHPPSKEQIGDLRQKVAKIAKSIEQDYLESSVDALNTALGSLNAQEKTDEAA